MTNFSSFLKQPLTGDDSDDDDDDDESYTRIKFSWEESITPYGPSRIFSNEEKKKILKSMRAYVEKYQKEIPTESFTESSTVTRLLELFHDIILKENQQVLIFIEERLKSNSDGADNFPVAAANVLPEANPTSLPPSAYTNPFNPLPQNSTSYYTDDTPSVTFPGSSEISSQDTNPLPKSETESEVSELSEPSPSPSPSPLSPPTIYMRTRNIKAIQRLISNLYLLQSEPEPATIEDYLDLFEKAKALIMKTFMDNSFTNNDKKAITKLLSSAKEIIEIELYSFAFAYNRYSLENFKTNGFNNVDVSVVHLLHDYIRKKDSEFNDKSIDFERQMKQEDLSESEIGRIATERKQYLKDYQEIFVDDNYIYAPVKLVDDLENKIQKAVDNYNRKKTSSDGRGETSADYFVKYFETGRKINRKEKEIMSKFQTDFRELINPDMNYDFVIKLIKALETIVKPNPELQKIIDEEKKMYKFFDIFNIPEVNYNDKMKEYIEYYEKLRPIAKKFDEFRKAQEEITKRDDTMKKLQSEIDTLKQKGNLTEDDKAKLAAKEAALNQQKKEKENLEQLHGKSIDEAMAKTLGGEKQKETALQQEVEKLKKELAAALAPASAPTASSEGQEQIQKLEAQIKTLETLSAKQKEEIAAEKEKVNKLETEKKAVTEEVAVRVNSNNAIQTEKDKQIADLNVKVTDLESTLAKQKIENETEQNQCAEQKTQLDNLINEKAKIEAELVTHKEQLGLERELNKKIDDLQDALINDNTNEDKKSQLQSLKEELAQIQQKTPSSEGARELAKVMEENAQNKAQADQLKVQLEGSEKMKTQMEELLAAKTAEVEKVKQDLIQEKEQLVAAKTAEVEKIKQELNQEKEQLVAAKTAEVEKVKQELDAAKTTEAELTKQLNETKTKASETENVTITNLKAQLEEAIKNNNVLKASCETEKQTLTEKLTADCDKKKTEMETTIKENCEKTKTDMMNNYETEKERIAEQKKTELREAEEQYQRNLKDVENRFSEELNKEKIKKDDAMYELKSSIKYMELPESSAEYNMTLIMKGTELKENDLLSFTVEDGANNVAMELDEYLTKIKFLFDIFNSEIMIKLACLLMNEALLLAVVTNNKLGTVKSVTDIFFVEVKDYLKIINNMKLYHQHLDATISRDTAVLKKLTKNENNVIFVYTLLKYLVKNFGEYVKTYDLVQEMIKFINTLVGGGKKGNNIFNNIVTIYENLRKNNASLEGKHNELTNSISNNFAYIKYRQDSSLINPRYQVKIVNQGQSKYLHVRYKNLDGNFGFFHDTYIHEWALRQINQKLLSDKNDGNGKKKRFVEAEQPTKPIETIPTKSPIKSITDEIKEEEDEESIIRKQVERKEKEVESMRVQNEIDDKKLDELQIPDYFYFGSFNGCYTSMEKNDKIVKDIMSHSSSIITKLLKGEDLCLVGYGQSGSGKTSALIFQKTREGNIIDGIIIEILKLEEFRKKFGTIIIHARNLYTFHWESNMDYNSYDSENYINNEIVKEGIELTYKDGNWSSDENKVVGEIIDGIFSKREIEPTPNNPESSRSHLICCLTLIPRDDKGKGKGKKTQKIIICDLAGVENVFKCDDFAEVLKFDSRYKESKNYNGKISYDSYFKKQGKPEYYKHTEKNLFPVLKTFEKENESIDIYNRYNFDGGDGDDLSSVSSNSSDSSSVSSNSSNSPSEDDLSSVSSNSTDFLSPSEGDGNTSLSSSSLSSSSFDDDDDDESSFLSDDSLSVDTNDGEEKDEEFARLLDGATEEDKEKFVEKCKNARLSSVNATSLDDLRNKIETEYEKLLPEFTKINNPSMVLQDFVEMFKNKKWENVGGKAYNRTISDLILKEKYKDFKRSNKIFNELYNDTSLKKKHSNPKKDPLLLFITDVNNPIDGNMFIAVCSYYLDLDMTFFIESEGKQFHITSETDYNAQIKKAEEKIKESKEKLQEIREKLYLQLCLKHRLDAISYNCQLRVIEGTMINHSLAEFRRDMKNIILYSLKVKNGGVLPLMYEENIATYCRNLYMMSDYYDTFDEPLDDNTVLDEKKLGAIFKIIKKNFEVDLTKINFGIFTIINLSDSTGKESPFVTKTNNPPTPPYINLSGLIYKLPIQYGGMSHFKENEKGLQREDTKQKMDIVKTLSVMLNKIIDNYEFYKDNRDLLDLRKNLLSLDVEKVDYKVIHEKFMDRFIRVINSNNPSTLIGSLQGTQELIRPASSIIIPCYNKELYDKQSKLFRRGDAKIEIQYGGKGSNTITDEQFNKTLEFKGNNLF